MNVFIIHKIFHILSNFISLNFILNTILLSLTTEFQRLKKKKNLNRKNKQKKPLFYKFFMFILKIKPNFETEIHVVPKTTQYNTLIW